VASQEDLIRRLTATWETKWPQTPPISFLVRELHPDLWVQFHSLPKSKRYAETDDERRIVLSRHHAVLEALDPSSECFVISPLWDPPGEDSALVGSVHWQTIEVADEYDEPVQIFVTSLTYPSARFDALLMACADNIESKVIIGPDDLRWLYNPYDGGAHVIASSTTERDQLRARFESWLPEVAVLVDHQNGSAYYLGSDLVLVWAPLRQGRVEIGDSRVVEGNEADAERAAREAAIKLALLRAEFGDYQSVPGAPGWVVRTEVLREEEEAQRRAEELAAEAGLPAPPKLDSVEINWTTDIHSRAELVRLFSAERAPATRGAD
jgi:hypothetical protein